MHALSVMTCNCSLLVESLQGCVVAGLQVLLYTGQSAYHNANSERNQFVPMPFDDQPSMKVKCFVGIKTGANPYDPAYKHEAVSLIAAYRLFLVREREIALSLAHVRATSRPTSLDC